MLWETKESKAAGEVQALQMLQVSEEKNVSLLLQSLFS